MRPIAASQPATLHYRDWHFGSVSCKWRPCICRPPVRCFQLVGKATSRRVPLAPCLLLHYCPHVAAGELHFGQARRPLSSPARVSCVARLRLRPLPETRADSLDWLRQQCQRCNPSALDEHDFEKPMRVPTTSSPPGHHSPLGRRYVTLCSRRACSPLVLALSFPSLHLTTFHLHTTAEEFTHDDMLGRKCVYLSKRTRPSHIPYPGQLPGRATTSP